VPLVEPCSAALDPASHHWVTQCSSLQLMSQPFCAACPHWFVPLISILQWGPPEHLLQHCMHACECCSAAQGPHTALLLRSSCCSPPCAAHLDPIQQQQQQQHHGSPRRLHAAPEQQPDGGGGSAAGGRGGLHAVGRRRLWRPARCRQPLDRRRSQHHLFPQRCACRLAQQINVIRPTNPVGAWNLKLICTPILGCEASCRSERLGHALGGCGPVWRQVNEW
jgi:hypothetical protein